MQRLWTDGGGVPCWLWTGGGRVSQRLCNGYGLVVEYYGCTTKTVDGSKESVWTPTTVAQR